MDIEAIPAFLAQVEQTQTLCLGGRDLLNPAISPHRRHPLQPAQNPSRPLQRHDIARLWGTPCCSSRPTTHRGRFHHREVTSPTPKRRPASMPPTPSPIPSSGAEAAGPVPGERPLHLGADAGQREGVSLRKRRSRPGLRKIWQAMQGCVERGCKSEGCCQAVSRSSAGSRPLSPALLRDQFQQGSADGDGWVDLCLAVNRRTPPGAGW